MEWAGRQREQQFLNWNSKSFRKLLDALRAMPVVLKATEASLPSTGLCYLLASGEPPSVKRRP